MINALRILFSFPVDRTNSLYMNPWPSGYVLAFIVKGVGSNLMPGGLVSREMGQHGLMNY